MSQRARLTLNLTVEDAGHPVLHLPLDLAWSNSILKQETVALPATTFTALTPPTGASLAVIDLGSAPSLKLRGVTGDTGTPLTPASNVIGAPLVVPLGTTPALGIYNGDASAHDVVVYWLGRGSGVVPD